MIARGATRLVRPAGRARRTSSSDTKSTAGGLGVTPGAGGAGPAAGAFEPSRSSRKAATWSRRGADALTGVGRPRASRGSSYASRLILMRWSGVMLSEVMFPAYAPQPRLIEGASPVV